MVENGYPWLPCLKMLLSVSGSWAVSKMLKPERHNLWGTRMHRYHGAPPRCCSSANRPWQWRETWNTSDRLAVSSLKVENCSAEIPRNLYLKEPRTVVMGWISIHIWHLSLDPKDCFKRLVDLEPKYWYLVKLDLKPTKDCCDWMLWLDVVIESRTILDDTWW